MLSSGSSCACWAALGRAARAARDSSEYAHTAAAPTTKRAAALAKNGASGPTSQMRGFGAAESCHSDRPRVNRSKALKTLPPPCKIILGSVESVRCEVDPEIRTVG